MCEGMIKYDKLGWIPSPIDVASEFKEDERFRGGGGAKQGRAEDGNVWWEKK